MKHNKQKQILPVYVEVEPNEHWEVRGETADGLLLGDIYYITYSFPLNIFIKGEYWFIPKYKAINTTIGKTKEKAFEKFLELYCDAEVKAEAGE